MLMITAMTSIFFRNLLYFELFNLSSFIYLNVEIATKVSWLERLAD